MIFSFYKRKTGLLFKTCFLLYNSIMKTIKTIREEYHLSKDQLTQFLLEQNYIKESENIDLLECPESLEKLISSHLSAIKHIALRNKYTSIDEYKAPLMIPMTYTILGIDHFVVLDTETTGLYRNDEVIELSVLDELGHELYHSLFHPQKKMAREAIRITGMDNAYLKNQPYFKDEWETIKNVIGTRRILGHNIQYDYRIMLATAQRYHMNTQEIKYLFNDMIDSIELIKRYIKTPSYKLKDLIRLFGVEESQRHRASYDCLQTLQVLRKVERYLIERTGSKERINMDTIRQAVLLSYKLGKSIEDISIFFGISTNETADLIIEAYHKEHDFDLQIDSEVESKILFLKNNCSKEEFKNKALKYAKEYEIKLIIAKNKCFK